MVVKDPDTGKVYALEASLSGISVGVLLLYLMQSSMKLMIELITAMHQQSLYAICEYYSSFYHEFR